MKRKLLLLSVLLFVLVLISCSLDEHINIPGWACGTYEAYYNDSIVKVSPSTVYLNGTNCFSGRLRRMQQRERDGEMEDGRTFKSYYLQNYVSLYDYYSFAITKYSDGAYCLCVYTPYGGNHVVEVDKYGKHHWHEKNNPR